MKTACFILLAAVSLSYADAYSQSSINKIFIVMNASESVPVDSVENPVNGLTPLMEYSLHFDISTTLNVASIDVLLGTEDGLSDMLDHTFTFDDENQAAPYTFSRNNSQVKLGLGTHDFDPETFCEIVLNYSDGSSSGTFSYPSN